MARIARIIVPELPHHIIPEFAIVMAFTDKEETLIRDRPYLNASFLK